MTVPPCVRAERLYLDLRSMPHAVQNSLRAWCPEGKRFAYTALRDDPAWCAEVEQKALELLVALDGPKSTFTGTTTRVDPAAERVVEHYEDGVLLGTVTSTVRDDTSATTPREAQ